MEEAHFCVLCSRTCANRGAQIFHDKAQHSEQDSASSWARSELSQQQQALHRGSPQCSGDTSGISDPRASEKSASLHPAPLIINNLLQQSHVFYHNTNDTQWREHRMGVLRSQLFTSCIKALGLQCLEAAWSEWSWAPVTKAALLMLGVRSAWPKITEKAESSHRALIWVKHKFGFRFPKQVVNKVTDKSFFPALFVWKLPGLENQVKI